MTAPPRLSPSDLTFLWEECPGCFYERYVLDIRRPRMPFPAIFGNIDGAMKAFYAPRTLRTPDGLRATVLNAGTEWVKSDTIDTPSGSCTISGKFDTILAVEDGTYAIVDFKCAEVKEQYLAKYTRQLAAYALAVSTPA